MCKNRTVYLVISDPIEMVLNGVVVMPVYPREVLIQPMAQSPILQITKQVSEDKINMKIGRYKERLESIPPTTANNPWERWCSHRRESPCWHTSAPAPTHPSCTRRSSLSPQRNATTSQTQSESCCTQGCSPTNISGRPEPLAANRQECLEASY